MTEAIILVAAVVFFTMFGIALMGMLSPRGDHVPLSPDEEYQWLTEVHGLSHEEALEVMEMGRPDG